MFDQYLKSKKSKIILAIAIIFVVLFAYVSISNSQNKKYKNWQPITQEIILEYGKSDTIDKKRFIRVNDDVEIISIELDIPYVHSSNNEESYYELGNYDGLLTVQAGKYEQEHPFKVIVKDTIAPRFTKFSERIVVSQGYSGDFMEFFEFEDVDSVIVEINTETINTYVPSVYTSSVKAKDSSNNVTERKIFVEVKGEMYPEVPTVPVDPPTDDNEIIKTHKDIIVFEDIAYNVKRISDSDLPVGEEIVEQSGKLGKKEINVRVFYENNKEVRREKMKESIKDVPQDEIIRYGTKEVEESVEGAFGEYPNGLIQYETYIEDDITFGKEYYESVDEAIIRGEDLIKRKLISEYTQRSVTFGETKYYYILFNIQV